MLSPEIANPAAQWLKRTYGMPIVSTVPIGIGATRDFLAEVRAAAGLPPRALGAKAQAGRDRLTWYARSVDSTYLTRKRVFIFGEATHAVAAARIATEELGFTVCGLGTYMREFAREIRDAAARYGVEPLITDDHLEVEDAIMAARPELVLGTQMERHIAKRLRLPCAVISAPAHVQDFPARYAPQMGYEGANVIFDSWVHPLMMGLEEHLLQMFRSDFEFNDQAAASHLHPHPVAPAAPAPVVPAPEAAQPVPDESADSITAIDVGTGWTADAERELKKVPFFVRGKARRNTEAFAASRGIRSITVETLYDAKAHFAR